MTASTLAALFLAASAPSAADRAALDAAVAAIYRPYKRNIDPSAQQRRSIYTAQIQSLIVRWEHLLGQQSFDIDGLNAADWLCRCQDWNAQRFRADIRSRQFASATTAIVIVHVDAGVGVSGTINDMRFHFKRENGAWKIDDMFDQGSSVGLQQELRETIAEYSRR